MRRKKKKHLKLQDSIQLIQTCFLMKFFLNQNSRVGPKGTGMRAQSMKLLTSAEGYTSANILTNKSPPKGSEEEGEGARASPSNIFVLSTAKTAMKRSRPATR
jgi:hypothetical protein